MNANWKFIIMKNFVTFVYAVINLKKWWIDRIEGKYNLFSIQLGIYHSLPRWEDLYDDINSGRDETIVCISFISSFEIFKFKFQATFETRLDKQQTHRFY